MISTTVKSRNLTPCEPWFYSIITKMLPWNLQWRTNEIEHNFFWIATKHYRLLWYLVWQGKNHYSKSYLILNFLAHSSGLLEQAFRRYLDYKSRKHHVNLDFRAQRIVLSSKIKVHMVFPALVVEISLVGIFDTLNLDILKWLSL